MPPVHVCRPRAFDGAPVALPPLVAAEDLVQRRDVAGLARLFEVLRKDVELLGKLVR